VRQAEFMFERRLKTSDWSMRVNFGILGIIFTEAWYLYQQTVATPDNSPNEFFSKLADEMIDNKEGLSARTVSPTEFDTDDDEEIDNEPDLRLTRRVRPSEPMKKAQGRCGGKSCDKYSSFVCSACTHPTYTAKKQHWFCRPGNGCNASKNVCTRRKMHRRCNIV